MSGLEGALESALTHMLAKAKHDINEGFKLAMGTARAFNNACLWCMKEPMLSPDHARSYSWFTLWSLHNQGQIGQRKPWHTHVDIQEAMDIFQQVKRLLEACESLEV